MPPSSSAWPCKFCLVLKPQGCVKQSSPPKGIILPRSSRLRPAIRRKSRFTGNPMWREGRSIPNPARKASRDREDLLVTVAIVDYGSGNLHSARKAFERAAREAGLSETITVTSDPDVVFRADRIVLPGVGAFADCRAGLDAVPGMVAAMTAAVHDRGRPFLGICVGMHLLAGRG